MPSLRNDFVALVKDSNKEVSIPGFSFKEYHAN
jgi:hypothetical protein